MLLVIYCWITPLSFRGANSTFRHIPKRSHPYCKIERQPNGASDGT